METSKFKWMEDLNKEDLHKAVTNLSFTDKLDLIGEIASSDNHSENNLKVVIVAQSQVIGKLIAQLTGNKSREDMNAISHKLKSFSEPELQPLQDYTAAEVTAFDGLKTLVEQLDKTDVHSKMYSVLGMVATLIEDDHLSKLDMVIRENFKEYYFNDSAA